MTDEIVDILVRRKIINNEDREIYEYGIKMGIMYVVFFLTAFLCAFILNEIVPFLTALVIFIMLRRNAGGYHAKTIYGCFFLSQIYMLGVLLFVKCVRNVSSRILVMIWILSLCFLVETIVVKGIGTKKHVGDLSKKYLMRTYRKLVLINLMVVMSVILKLHFVIAIVTYSYLSEGIVLRLKNK